MLMILISKKDYKTAHKLFLSLATDGVAQAQNNLGWMYSKGQGVPKDSVSHICGLMLLLLTETLGSEDFI